MTTSSVGYDGSISEVQWAGLSEALGGAYSVKGSGDWKVTTVPAVDRTVSIAAGTGYGRGVQDVLTPAVTVQLPVVASGTRWDTIVAARDWQPPGGATMFIARTGTSSQLIAASRLTNPGVQDDQPIALVQVTAGVQLPTAIVDLRTWSSKVITANSLLALPDAGYGCEAVVAGIRYRREFDAVGTIVWKPSSSLWSTFTPVCYQHMSTTPVVIGASVQYARMRTVGPNTTHAQVSVVPTATTTGGVAISLPVAGTYRNYECGTMGAFGPSTPADQCGIAQMWADNAKVVLLAYSNGYRDTVAGSSLRYDVVYESV